MKFFKNSDLTALYNISDKAIRNWIQAAKDEKNELELYSQDGVYYIADSLNNIQVIESLVEKGRKYRNHRSHRPITPLPSFYEIFSSANIYDIINRLEIDHDLPGQYKYFGAGASYWDKYLYKLKESGSKNILSNTLEVLSLNEGYLDKLIEPYKNVNVVNICVGNCLAIEQTLKRLAKNKKLNKIQLIDISNDMLQISKRHIDEWLDHEYEVGLHVRDLSHQKFDDILMANSFGSDASNTINLIFFLAGPIANFRYPDQALYTIGDSMSKDDLLITTLKRDTPQSRSFFDFGIKGESVLISRHDSFLLQHLNIEPSFYEIEQFYDEDIRMRSMQIRLKVDLSIDFTVDKYQKRLEFKKGESIRLWKAWHHSDREILDRFSRTGFETLNISRSTDQQLNFLISKVRDFARHSI